MVRELSVDILKSLHEFGLTGRPNLVIPIDSQAMLVTLLQKLKDRFTIFKSVLTQQSGVHMN